MSIHWNMANAAWEYIPDHIRNKERKWRLIWAISIITWWEDEIRRGNISTLDTLQMAQS